MWTVALAMDTFPKIVLSEYKIKTKPQLHMGLKSLEIGIKIRRTNNTKIWF